jgi:rsbT co-antagonist protein RsbR
MPRTLLQKMTFAGSTVVLLSMVIIGLATSSGLAIRSAFHSLINHGVVQANQSQRFTAHLSRALSEATFFALTRHPAERMHTETALQQAREALVAIKHPDDQYYLGMQAAFLQIQQRRTALLTTAQREIPRLLAAVDAGDTAVVDQTVETLKTLNDELEQLDIASDAIVDQEVSATTRIMQASLWRGVLTIGGSLAVLILGILLGFLLVRRFVVQPVSSLAHAAHLVAQGSFDQSVTVTSTDEIGSLQQAFNHMVANLRDQHQLLDERRINAEKAHATLTSAYQQIQAQFTTIEKQQTLLRKLSVPVLPLTASTLVVPLVGSLDTSRLAMLQQHVLQALERSTVQHVILDLTGVPDVDTEAAQGMIEVVYAARLLGAEVIVAGINPAVAQSMLERGIDVSTVTTRSSLQHAIAYMLTQDLPNTG